MGAEKLNPDGWGQEVIHTQIISQTKASCSAGGFVFISQLLEGVCPSTDNNLSG